jgi:hypothetical protein
MIQSEKVVGRIGTMTNLSDQLAVVTSLSGDQPVVFPPAMSLRISAID